MTAKILAVLSLLAFLAAGCAVGPDYHAPKTPVSKNWSEPLEGGATNRAVDIIEWWSSFNDAMLNSLVARAVQSNQDVRIAEARLRQARAQLGFAQADFSPAVDAAASYTRLRTSRNSLIPGYPTGLLDENVYQAGFDASWEIDVFGGKRRALEAAHADVGAGVEDVRDTLVSLLAEVARSYVVVRGFQRRLAIAHDDIRSEQATLKVTRARFEGGATSELDVAQATAQLAATQAQLPALEAPLDQAMHQLAVLLGQEPGALVAELSRDAPIPPTPPEVPVGLPSDLLRRRPDVRRAERQLASATAQIGVQTAELFPKFSLTGNTAGFESLSLSDWFTVGSRYWSLGPTVTWRILDAARIRANIRAQTVVQEQALAIYEKTVLTSLQEAEDSLVAYAKEQVRNRSLLEEVVADQRALELANKQYTAGITTFLNVLDTERSLYAAEDDLVQSQASVTTNLIALYKALGGGWEKYTAAAARSR